jgi:phage-related holin
MKKLQVNHTQRNKRQNGGVFFMPKNRKNAGKMLECIDTVSVYKAGAAATGAVYGFFFGERSALLGILLALVLIDYGTGMLAAYFEGRLRSAIGFKRIPKKVMIFAMVAHLVDRAVGTNDEMRRSFSI